MFGINVLGRRSRQFEYKPRYFDPEKEARDARRRELNGAQSEERDPDKEYRPGEYIRQSMYARRGIGSSNKAGVSTGILKKVIMVIIAAFIVGMMWLLS